MKKIFYVVVVFLSTILISCSGDSQMANYQNISQSLQKNDFLAAEQLLVNFTNDASGCALNALANAKLFEYKQENDSENMQIQLDFAKQALEFANKAVGLDAKKAEEIFVQEKTSSKDFIEQYQSIVEQFTAYLSMPKEDEPLEDVQGEEPQGTIMEGLGE